MIPICIMYSLTFIYLKNIILPEQGKLCNVTYCKNIHFIIYQVNRKYNMHYACIGNDINASTVIQV